MAVGVAAADGSWRDAVAAADLAAVGAAVGCSSLAGLANGAAAVTLAGSANFTVAAVAILAADAHCRDAAVVADLTANVALVLAGGEAAERESRIGEVATSVNAAKERFLVGGGSKGNKADNGKRRVEHSCLRVSESDQDE